MKEERLKDTASVSFGICCVGWDVFATFVFAMWPVSKVEDVPRNQTLLPKNTKNYLSRCQRCDCQTVKKSDASTIDPRLDRNIDDSPENNQAKDQTQDVDYSLLKDTLTLRLPIESKKALKSMFHRPLRKRKQKKDKVISIVPAVQDGTVDGGLDPKRCMSRQNKKDQVLFYENR